MIVRLRKRKPGKDLMNENVVLIYQDGVARERAVELWDRVAQLVGKDVARCVAWSIQELSSPEALAKAAAATIHAEVIVVALSAAEKLPPGLGAWIDIWLPQRCRRDGALMAVMGVSGQPAPPSDHAQEYLRATARQGGMEYLLQEHSAGKASTPGNSRRTEQ